MFRIFLNKIFIILIQNEKNNSWGISVHKIRKREKDNI